MTSCTALHMVEEFIGVPYRYYKEYPGSFVILKDGTRVPSRSKEYIKQPGYINDFEKIEGLCSKQGILNYAKAGNAKLISVTMTDLYNFTERQINLNPYFLARKEL